MTATLTRNDPAGAEPRKQKARQLFARLRHKQLLSAMSGRINESAVYAQRALRVRRALCPCSA